MALPTWNPPARIESSPAHRGETTKEAIFVAVISALSEWERLETPMADLFSHLIETSSRAARRAYGTIQGAEGRRHALEAAATIFFRSRPQST
jgi:hypothetical protein